MEYPCDGMWKPSTLSFYLNGLLCDSDSYGIENIFMKCPSLPSPKPMLDAESPSKRKSMYWNPADTVPFAGEEKK